MLTCMSVSSWVSRKTSSLCGVDVAALFGQGENAPVQGEARGVEGRPHRLQEATLRMEAR